MTRCLNKEQKSKKLSVSRIFIGNFLQSAFGHLRLTHVHISALTYEEEGGPQDPEDGAPGPGEEEEGDGAAGHQAVLLGKAHLAA